MAIITDISLWALFRHLRSWLANLRRAGEARKQQSTEALRAVILAARHTRTYVRQLKDKGIQDHTREAKLCDQWTSLGFKLDDLGLKGLAKRCDISGRYWSDPQQFEADFLQRADIGLERMEKLARELLLELEG